MRIQKKYQGTLPSNKILDTHSTSNTDTYSCNYVNTKANTYSTDEKVIGTWINGKPLYRKIFIGTLNSNREDTGITRELNSTVCDYANVKGYIGDYQQNGMSSPGYVNSNWYSGFYINDGVIDHYGGPATRGLKYQFIVEYTKRSD